MIRAYHFVGGRLRDGRPIPPDGEWLTHEGPVAMCSRGLHASRHPADALFYAPGAVLCLVDCDDVADKEKDKLVCRRRRIVARFDATRLLVEYAADCAESVLHLVQPDSQLACIWAIDAARRYARGECDDDDELTAAHAAADDAARAAAAAAAAAAARAAANTAAWAAWAAWAARAAVDVADYAANAAAWAERAAAYAAAYAAEHDAATNALRDDFAERVNAQFRSMGVEV